MNGSKSCKPPSSSPATPATSGASGVASVNDPEIKALIKRAETGDHKALRDLKDKFRGRLGEIFDHRVGNPALLMRYVLSHEFTRSDNLIAGEKFERHAKILGKRIAGSNPDPLVKMAADLVVVCWLDLYRRYGQMPMEGGNPIIGAHRDKMLNSATKRLTMAVGMLDKLKRTDLSGLLTVMGGNVQVNVDTKGQPQAVDVTDV